METNVCPFNTHALTHIHTHIHTHTHTYTHTHTHAHAHTYARIRDGIRHILNISRLGNVYIQANKPWKLVKGTPEEMYVFRAVCM